MLQTVSARSESLKPLRPNELAACECVNCLIEITSTASNKPGLVLQCLHIFQNLVKDAELCGMMQESFNMDHVLAGVLKTYGGSPDDNLTLVCLQLLQKVTYGHRISFHESFVDELIKYLVKQLVAPASAVTPWCLGVLANLCHDNFPVQARLKAMDNVQRVYKTLCKYFSDQDLTTAVFALSVFTSLSVTEELGDKVFFNSQNIKQVLQLVCNVLVNGEGLTARLYAVDLLQDMLRNPRLQQAVEEYANLPKCLEDTLKLISSSSATSVAKVRTPCGLVSGICGPKVRTACGLVSGTSVAPRLVSGICGQGKDCLRASFWDLCGPKVRTACGLVSGICGQGEDCLRASFWDLCGPKVRTACGLVSGICGQGKDCLRASFWDLCGPKVRTACGLVSGICGQDPGPADLLLPVCPLCQILDLLPVCPLFQILDLLISFCSLGSVRSCLCRLLFSAPLPPAEQLGSILGHPPRPDCPPLVGALCWASLPGASACRATLASLHFLREMYEGHASGPPLPQGDVRGKASRRQSVAAPCRATLAAFDFLREMYKVLLCGEDQDLQSGVALVVPVLVQILRAPLSPDTPHTHMKDACRRLAATLRLCRVLCAEDEFKACVAQSVRAEDFDSILRFQLASNKSVQKSATALKYLDQDQDWSEAGVEVVLLAMQLMSKIRRYVQGLEELFLHMLQDNEMVPFLAKGWASREGELVQIALQLTCLGASLDRFPDVILGDAVAAVNSGACVSGGRDSLDVSANRGGLSGADPGSLPLGPRPDLTLSVQDDSIQSLIDKMHSAIELKDFKTADIIEIYEHRLQSHQTKEDHLQDLLEAKSLALTQADRLIAQYRSRQARHGAEAHKMRCLFQEAERKNEGLVLEMNHLKLDKDRLKNDYDLLKHEKNQLELKALELEELKSSHSDLTEKCEELESTLTRLQQELKTTSEMHEMLQKHYEALKHQHDVASDQLKKLEDERKQLSRTLKNKESKLLVWSQC
ncbi:hypothetical protein ACOMHN_008036 [Nucella lapillus]